MCGAGLETVLYSSHTSSKMKVDRGKVCMAIPKLLLFLAFLDIRLFLKVRSRVKHTPLKYYTDAHSTIEENWKTITWGSINSLLVP